MAKIERQRRSALEWQALVARQASSGESVAQFCAHEKLSAASFYQWRARLRGDQADGATSERASSAGAFVDLGDLRVGANGVTVRLDFGGGLVLQLTRS